MEGQAGAILFAITSEINVPGHGITDFPTGTLFIDRAAVAGPTLKVQQASGVVLTAKVGGVAVIFSA